MVDAPMWTCAACGRRFATRNQTHTCAPLGEHLVLARRVDSPRFARIEEFGPTNVLHAFRLVSPDKVDADFTAWLRESFDVGRQLHRRRPGER